MGNSEIDFSRVKGGTDIVYLDHAATSWPKPQMTRDFVSAYLPFCVGNARGTHRLADLTTELIASTRRAIRHLFWPEADVVFVPSATYGLNLVMRGLGLGPGDLVMSTSFDHNAIARVTYLLQAEGVKILRVDTTRDAFPLEVLSTAKPRLVALTHSSNVTGSMVDIETIGRAARRSGAIVVVDAAQSLGKIPVTFDSSFVDFVIGAGHKGLGSLPGVGLVLLSPKAPLLSPLIAGGTGMHSEHLEMPSFIPERFEVGTLDTLAIVSLLGGVKELVTSGGVQSTKKHVAELLGWLADLRMPGLTWYAAPPEENSGVMSFTVDGQSPAQTVLQLESEFGIVARGGLHCAPIMHQSLGTFPLGTVRVSVGATNTRSDVEHFRYAVRNLVAKRN
jgi:cysteine desulfurase/selenocysteine lyase